MTFLYKLSHRITIARFTMLAVVASGCQTEQRDFLSPNPNNSTLPTSIEITPRIGSVLPGESIKFTAQGRAANGAQVAVDVDWSATGGTIQPDGTFVSADMGVFAVMARVRGQSLVDSATVSVYLTPNDILALEVTPDSSELLEGDHLQLHVWAQLANGTRLESPPLRWSATGGEVTDEGLYSASSEGNHEITAEASTGVQADAMVVVRRRDRSLVGVAVSPASVALQPGSSQLFQATSYSSDGLSEPAKVSWQATGGSINSDGLYVAGSKPGTYQVIGRYRSGLSDTASVTVRSVDFVRLTVTPGQVSVATSANQQFVATATMSDGSSKQVGVSWRASGGSIGAGGLYTAPSQTGEYLITAELAGTGLSDSAGVEVVQPTVTVSQLVLNPTSASVPTGTSRQFSVTALYSDGSSGVPAVTWSATGGTISSGGLYLAGATSGTYRVIATEAASGKADTSQITVTAPLLTQISLSPETFSVEAGHSQQLQVSGTLSDGSSTVPTVAWIVSGGTVSSTGLFTAGTVAGTYRVVATASGLADTSYATITPSPAVLTSLILTPSAQTLVTGGTQQFSVSGLWSDGTTGAPAVTWTATGGTISSGGLYTAGQTTGTYKVIAVQQGGTKADTSVVTISSPPATLTSLVVSPGSASIGTGASKQFTVSATWSDGSTQAPNVVWSATGGTITSGGLFVAGSTAGNYRVVALHQTSARADTAEVTVTAATLNAVVLSPGSASLQVGQTQQFTAAGLYSNGTTGTVSVNWSATGGTISSGGLYTAGKTTGTFRVIAVQQNGTKADTASVTIAAPPPPGTFPSGYDPARLGTALLAGVTWQNLGLGSTDLIAWGKQLPRQWGTVPPDALVSIVSDPIFGKVYKMVQPAESRRSDNNWPNTIQLIHYLPHNQSRLWMRMVIKLDGQTNPKGFTSYGTQIQGGSTTYKMLFLRSADGQQRHEFELYSGGDFLLMGSTKPGNNFSGESSTRLGQGGAPVPPVTKGSTQYEGTQPLAGWLNAADNGGGSALTTKDWFEYVINYEYVSGTVLQRFFLRRLTVNGSWSPAQYPAWVGWRTVSSQARDYNEVFMGANKSQSNDGPDDQFVFFGPFEVSTAVDPYGWDRYGR